MMTEQEILKRALRAAQALTLGGMIAATAACDEEVPVPGDSSDTSGDTTADGSTDDVSATDTVGVDTPTPDVEADLSPADTGEDAIEDEGGEDADETDAESDTLSDADPDGDSDVEADIDPDAPPRPDVDPDAPPRPDVDEATCKAVADGVCPDACTQDTDVDCCDEIEWCSWDADFGCACAVPGPFVPPTMG